MAQRRRAKQPRHPPDRRSAPAARQPPRRDSSSPPTDWGDVAQWYDQLVGESGSEYQREIVFPGVLKLLELKAGERVLDVACGQGVLCRVLQQAGAAVTGIDAAAELIRIARERSDPAIEYLIGDARELPQHPQLAAASFDAATCVLAVQNIHPLPPLIAGMGDLLKRGGRLVLAMMHPCFRSPKATAWGWDESAEAQYRRVDRYLLPRKEPIVTHPGKDPHRYTWTFHRPLQSYFKALRQAGFVVDALEEWTSHKTSQAGPRAAAENLARKEIPMFLALRAVKLSETPRDDANAD